MTTRSLRVAAATLSVLLVVALPVAAKEGFEARLDAPLSTDSPSGSTLTVGWTVFTMVDGEDVPMVGSPVFIRLLPRGGGEPVTEFGTEEPSGSGHYVTDIVVPESGVGIVEIGLRGEMCEAGVCSTSDILFHLSGDTLVAGDVPGAVTGIAAAADPVGDPAASAAGLTVPAAPAAVVDPDGAPIGAFAVGLMVVAALAVVSIVAATSIRRRRTARA